jgi:hypothetical protein
LYLYRWLKPFAVGWFFNHTSPSALVLETFFSIVKKGFKLPKKYSCTKHGALPHTPLAF